MGAKCCVSVRENAPTILREKYRARSRKFSPTLSLRWDNRTHIEDIVDDRSVDVGSQVESSGNNEIEGVEDGSSSSETSQRVKRQAGIAGLSILNSPSNETRGEREINESGTTASSMDPSSSTTHRLPGPRASRQVFEGKVLPLDSINEEDKPPFIISFCNNDLHIRESYSDGWFLNSLPELMLSSQCDNTMNFTSSLQTCGLCSKQVKERSSWPQSEISISAVLVCGHVYHAECLETVTTEASRFDPSCPICTSGESSATKGLVKADRRSKISKRAVADIDGNFVFQCQKNGSYILKDMRSKSGKSFGWSFLRRHFSLGSRPLGLVPENESLRKKKGLWATYR